MTKNVFVLAAVAWAMMGSMGTAAGSGSQVGDAVIANQRAALAAATAGKGFGPQSPRDIDSPAGANMRVFSRAPAISEMTLCDIHFHENAEHKGGMFTTYAGNGDGHGYGTGYKYDGRLTAEELAPVKEKIGVSAHGDLVPGDTIEIHFVFSTAQASLGNGLGTCLSDAIGNPQLRVESVVAVLVNDTNAVSFTRMAQIEILNGLHQLRNLPRNLGRPVVYEGSTTGPGYNKKASPFHVTWSVRPKVVKLDIHSLAIWLRSNPFNEDHAHGVRNLVVNPALLSDMRR